ALVFILCSFCYVLSRRTPIRVWKTISVLASKGQGNRHAREVRVEFAAALVDRKHARRPSPAWGYSREGNLARNSQRTAKASRSRLNPRDRRRGGRCSTLPVVSGLPQQHRQLPWPWTRRQAGAAAMNDLNQTVDEPGRESDLPVVVV